MHARMQAVRGPPSFSRSSAASAASPSGRSGAGPPLGERPVKVHAHSKLVKELTGLTILQELNAHNGEHAAVHPGMQGGNTCWRDAREMQ